MKIKRLNESLIDDLNSLDFVRGISKTNYELVKEYENILNRFPVGTILKHDTDAGEETFTKIDDIFWNHFRPHPPHTTTISTFDAARWFAGRGVITRGNITEEMSDNMKVNRLNESLTDDEFFEIQDIIGTALNSIGGDMDDITGGITSSYDEDRLLLSLYSTVDRKDARKFKKNFFSAIENALSQTRFSEVSQDENHTFAYQMSRNDIFNMLGSDRAEEFVSKFAMFEVCITAYGKKLEEAMIIGYDEGSIKEQIRILNRNIEDYQQLIIDEPEDKDYWEEQIKKCEQEIADLNSYKPIDEAKVFGAKGAKKLDEKLTGYKVTIKKDDKTFDDYACAYEEEGAIRQMKNKYGKDIEIVKIDGSRVIKEANQFLPIEVLNPDGTPEQYDVKFMDLERVPTALNWDIADQLESHFRKNNLWVEELHYNQVRNRIEFDINNGDWKHEHLRAKWLLEELFNQLGIRAEVNSYTTEEDGSDNYSAHYVVYSI